MAGSEHALSVGTVGDEHARLSSGVMQLLGYQQDSDAILNEYSLTPEDPAAKAVDLMMRVTELLL